MVKLNITQRRLILLVLTLNCLCVVGKLKFIPLSDHSSLWVNFFVEGFFNMDSLPVAILESNMDSSLNRVLPIVMMSMENSFFIFDRFPNTTNTKASFLIFEETNLVKIHQIFLRLDNMFMDKWSRTLFWFYQPISKQTENFIISQCTIYYITRIVISSPLENKSAFKLVTSNNVLNIENNYKSFTFHQKQMKNMARKVTRNMDRIVWDFEGAVLKVKAHPKYLMLQHSQTSGLSGLFGVDASALRNMANWLNFKVELVMGRKNHFGNTFPNGSLVSSIADLKRHKIDLNINRHVAISRPEVMLLPPLDNEEFCFILPYFRGYHKVTSLILYLTPGTWAMVLLAVLSSAVVWRIFNSISKTDDYPVLSLLQSLLTTRIFKVHRPFHMVFLVSWGGFVVILLSIFRGLVLKSTIKPFWVDEITNLEELFRSNLKIKNRIGIFQIARPNSTLEKLLNRSTVSYLIETDYEFRTSAYFTSKYFRMFLDTAFGRKDCYYTLPECLSDYHVSYLVSSRSPYFVGLQQKVLYLKQLGFYDAWFKHYKLKSKLITEGDSSFQFGNSTRDAKTRPFTLQDLIFAFYVQSAGMVLSLLVFLCEVMLHSWNDGQYEIPFVI